MSAPDIPGRLAAISEQRRSVPAGRGRWITLSCDERCHCSYSTLRPASRSRAGHPAVDRGDRLSTPRRPPALAAAGAILLLKVAALLAMIIPWIAMADEMRYGQIRRDDYMLMAALMVGTVFMARLLAAHARPLLVSTAAFGGYSTLLAAFVYTSRPTHLSDMPSSEDLTIALLSLAGGALVGHVLFALTTALVRKLDCALP